MYLWQMQVLLTTLNAKYIHTNLAIRLLYQLNKAYKDLAWKEFTINEEQHEIADNCSKYDIVAFSCYIWNITQTLQVAQLIKDINPTAKILIGGPEVSYEYDEIINLPFIDYIIVGEGEIPFNQFLYSYPALENVAGLVYKKNGKIIANKNNTTFDVALFKNIEPYIDDVTETLRNKVLYIETSRGCPYKCEFCLASLDNRVRYLPQENIENTLLFLMQHGKVIKFLDRTFNLKKDFTIRIFQFILDHHKQGNVFQFEITADIIHPAIVEFILEKVPKGLFRFEIGIQTVNQKANLAVKRKQDFEKTKSIILQLQDKIEMHLDLIVGLALDYYDDIKFSFEAVFKLFAPELQLGFLKFLKGTPVRDSYEQHGFEFDKNPPYQIIQSNYLTKNELAKIVALENALEIYWNKKRAIHTLKYVTQKYSIFDFLIGLGIYFDNKKSNLSYTLNDIYEIIYEYINAQYYTDNILKELVAIDYYLHHKTKPSVRFIHEIDKYRKQEILTTGKLNQHQFRYLVFDINFDYNLFISENKIIPIHNTIIIQYNGIAYATLISQNILQTID